VLEQAQGVLEQVAQVVRQVGGVALLELQIGVVGDPVGGTPRSSQ
jgi:hypothetical protein